LLLLALLSTVSAQLPPTLEWNVWIGQNFPTNGYLAAAESREFGLLVAAAHDGLNSVKGSNYRKYTPYIAYSETTLHTDRCDAWIVAASYKTLLHLIVDTRVNTEGTAIYFTPAQRASFHALIDARYNNVTTALGNDNLCETKGVKLGEDAANAVFEARADDGFNRTIPKPYLPNFQIGMWYPRPNEADVYPLKSFEKPLAVPTPYHFIVPPPVFDFDNADFISDMLYIKDKGSNGTTTRTAQESISAQFAVLLAGARYSAAMLTGMYPKLNVAFPGFSLRDFTRLHALLSLFQGDSYICGTNQKAKYNYWRPWQVITRANEWGLLYPKLAQLYDPNWVPYQVTPNHQEYPAGHPSASAGYAQVVRRITGWEVFPGGPITVNAPKPGIFETYNSLGEIKEKMVQARVFGGMHLRNSGRVGARMGEQIADYVVDNFLLPVA